jgi:hypothetical protein
MRGEGKETRMTSAGANGRGGDRALLVLAVILSLAGVGGFLFLFLRDFNVYWVILAPVILAVYQLPAAFVLWLRKRRRHGRMGGGQGNGAD